MSELAHIRYDSQIIIDIMNNYLSGIRFGNESIHQPLQFPILQIRLLHWTTLRVYRQQTNHGHVFHYNINQTIAIRF